MSETYKLKFQSSLFKVEMESSDSAFVKDELDWLMQKTASLQDSGRLKHFQLAEEAALATEEVSVSKAVPEEKPAEAEEPAPKTRGRKKGSAGKTEAKPAKAAKAAKAAKEKPVKEKGVRGRPSKEKSAPKEKEAVKRGRKPKAQAKEEEAPAVRSSGIDPKAVSDKVRSLGSFKKIWDEVINRPNQLGRILLGFYFSDQGQPGGQGLTTGDLEAITKALGKEIKSTNISSQLKKNPSLFETHGERRRGSVVHYSLTPMGKQETEKVLSKYA